jgi:hypothetical protein
MKQAYLSSLLALSLLTSHGIAAIAVAVSGTSSTKSSSGTGEFILEVLQVELSAKADFELVDRKRLQDTLSEQGLGASGLTGDQAARFGKLVGAKYFIFGETLQAGERTAVNCRVVQVETGVLKPILLPIAKDEDPVVAGQKLAGQVSDAIAKLEGREAAQNDSSKAAAKLELPAETIRPTLAFRIPETSVTPQARTADPAAEKALETFFLANDFKLVQLSRPSQSVPANAPQDKHVDILILGIATSDRATQIGNFSAARARVEIVAVRTSDSSILASSAGYGVGADLSNFVAEKKAIESATRQIQMGFAKEFLAKVKSK